jgi:hypothetical protein
MRLAFLVMSKCGKWVEFYPQQGQTNWPVFCTGIDGFYVCGDVTLADF